MDTLILIFACYFLIAMATCGVLFNRFMRRRDLRGRGAFELVDPRDGLLACIVFFYVAFFALALANPIRFAHLLLKAAFWPVTAWFWWQARQTGSNDDEETDAPRLDASFFEEVLRREGFPATPHNVFALQERLGIMFTVKAKQFMEATGDIDDWNAFVARAGYPRTAADMPSWPQRVLDALVAWDADVAPHLEDFPEKYVGILLEGKGNGSGFFGGSTDEPLPTATLDWTMKGLGQPDAVPVAPPAAPAVVAAPALPGPRETPTPSPAPAAFSLDEPRTAPIRLPRVDPPAGARSVRAMAVMSIPAPTAAAVPDRARVARHAAPTSAGHAMAVTDRPVPSPRTGRHARP